VCVCAVCTYISSNYAQVGQEHERREGERAQGWREGCMLSCDGVRVRVVLSAGASTGSTRRGDDDGDGEEEEEEESGGGGGDRREERATSSHHHKRALLKIKRALLEAKEPC